MAANRKPRKQYRPRPVDADPIGLAFSRAVTLGPTQRLRFIEPVAVAMLALKRGHATEQHWADLADALNVAEQLCALRICNDRLPAVLAGQAALHAIYNRHATLGRWVAKGEELRALADDTGATLAALDVHRVQVNHCSQGEMATAIQRATDRARQALAGNAPRDALVCVGGLCTASTTATHQPERAAA